MLCPNCHTPSREADLFCNECGYDLAADRSASAPQDDQTLILDPFQLPQTFEYPEPVDPLIGTTIDGKYRIDSKIGAGGMGAVYRGTRLLIGDEVAIKVLHLSESENQVAAERFRREAQAAARLKHANAVNIYDFGVSADGLQYLVMELVEGESLRQIIKGKGPLTPTASSEIITQVCSALDEAHSQHIIHRDIKPDNIIINTRSGGGLRVKVLDFGIAKLRDTAASSLTLTGSVMGTPHYMSPEQCLGEELDGRSDVYSLGIVLYEMLCGVVPFNSPTSTAVVVQHVNQPPPPLRLINPSISPGVESVILHALEKSREARPQTAGDLARELKAAVIGARQSAPLPGTVERPIRSTGPTRGFTPTMVMSTPPSGAHFNNVAAPQAAADKPRSTARIAMLSALATVLLLGLGGGGAWLLFRGQDEASANSTRNAVDANASAKPSEKDQDQRAASNVRADNLNDTATADNSNDSTTAATPFPTPADMSGARAEVMTVMNNWAGSLMRRDLYDNLRLYSDHLDVFYQFYDVGKDKVRASRQAAFNKFFSSVNIQLGNVTVEFDSSGTTATVYYQNSYDWRGGTRFLTGRSQNEMVISKIDGQWLITSEKHLKTEFEDSGK